MKNFILLLIFLIFTLRSFAGSPFIFKGNLAKNLASMGIEFADGKRIINGTIDPTGTAVFAAKGSLYLSASNKVYVKQDDGLSTDWKEIALIGGGGSYITDTLTSGQIIVGSALNVASKVTMSGEASISNTGAVTLANDSVIGKTLTGYTAGAGVVAATDTIKTAIQKLDGNIATKQSATLADGQILVGNGSNVATGVAMSGEATIANTGAVTLNNDAVIGKTLTGYTAGAGTVAATDTIKTAIQKLDGNIGAINPGNSALGVENLSIVTSVGSNALTIAVKNQAGNDPSAGDPVKVSFQDGTGGYKICTLSSALSLTVSSGSTLGTRSGLPHKLWFYLIDSDGSCAVKLGVTMTKRADGTVLTSVAEGGAGGADTNNVLYSDGAYTSRATRLVAVANTTQTTAGTWASNLSNLNLNPTNIRDIIFLYASSNNPQLVTAGVEYTMVYEDVDRDSHGIYNSATGIATLPRDSSCTITASFGGQSTTYATNQYIVLGVNAAYSNAINGNGSPFEPRPGTARQFTYTSGQTAFIKVFSSVNVTSNSSSGNNHISIKCDSE